jgi:hypothetical protein
MAKNTRRIHKGQGARPPQTANPALSGKKPLSPVVKRRPKGK